MELEIKNKKFLEYLSKHKGVISIGNFYQIKGCCNAVIMPSGRMVSPRDMFNPRDEKDYYFFSYDGMKIYIEKKLLEGKKEVEFLIISTAKFKIIKKDSKLIIV